MSRRADLAAAAVHAVALLVARLLAPAFSFAVTAVVARVLGPQVLGAYVYATALLLLAQTAAGGGLSSQLTREVAGRPARARVLVRHATAFAHLCALTAAVVLAAYAAFALTGEARLATLLLVPAVLPSGEMTVQEGVFLGGRMFRRVTLMAAIENGIRLALAGTALALGGGLAGVCVAAVVARWVAYAVGRPLAAATLDAVTGDAVPPATSAGAAAPAGVRAFAREALPWALLFTVSVAYFRVDILSVQALRGGAAVGLYGAASTLLTVMLLVPGSASAVAYPRLAAAFAKSRARFGAQARLATAAVVAVAVPPALVTFWLAAPLLTIAFGAPYAGAAGALRLLAVGLPFHAANAILGSVLQAEGRTVAMVRTVGVGLATQIGLALVLVPRVGIEGAAVALGAGAVLGTAIFLVETWPLLRGARAATARAEPAPSTSAVL